MTHNEDNCGSNHTEVQHKIMQLSEDVMMSALMTLTSEIAAGNMDPATAGRLAAVMLFANALETGLHAALMDPIGAQIILDHLNERAVASANELEEANTIIATDARQLLEAAARL